MEAAKASVKKVLSKSGQHDTTVHETVAPAVQNENISRVEHEKVIPAVEREVHQEHYHTTEQPVKHSEVLPETHHHRELPVQTQKFEHGRVEDIKRSLASEQSQYRDTQTRSEGEKTKSTEPVMAGEHVHHHVHETIQPVVQKQTIEPHVVHTTAPVHEVHHKEPQHHSAHALPPVSMDEFKNQGGSLKGREARQDFFAGEPKAFPGQTGTTGSVGAVGLDGHGQNPSSHNTHSQINPTTTSSSTTNPSTTDSSYSNTGAASKPGLLDRINPKKDADGDGKTGVMS